MEILTKKDTALITGGYSYWILHDDGTVEERELIIISNEELVNKELKKDSKETISD